jgi:outer membrane protein assembly factor BamB
MIILTLQKKVMMRNSYSVNLTLFILIYFNLTAVSQQNNWTHFRGNKLNGISNQEGVPITWNDSLKIVWKTKIDGRGWSSPVVFGDQVWVTSATEDGKKMFGICLNSKTGKVVFNVKLFEPDTILKISGPNSYATPTPCIELGFVYMHFGKYGTACIRTNDGSIAWKRTDLRCEDEFGPVSSPVIYRNLLFLHLEGSDKQSIIALNKRNGRIIWKEERPKTIYDKLSPNSRIAHTTPIIINVRGRDMLISEGSGVCIAYEPETGNEIWRISGGQGPALSTPIFENGVLFFYTNSAITNQGGVFSELLAVNPADSTSVTNSSIIWRVKFPGPQIITPLIRDGLIYTIDPASNLFCLDSRTGKTVYSNRLTGIYSSSPVYAGGNLYFTSLAGETIVVKAGEKLEVLGRNKLKGEVFATPAITNKSLILRVGSYLYCIGNQQ